MKHLLLALLSLVSTCAAAQSERVIVTGTWNEVIQALDASYTSDSAMTLDVRALGRPGRHWSLEVARSAAGWHPDLVLEVSLDKGRSFHEIGIAPTLVKEGTSHTEEVLELQYRLTGMTVAVPAGTYATMVSFTITFED